MRRLTTPNSDQDLKPTGLHNPRSFEPDFSVELSTDADQFRKLFENGILDLGAALDLTRNGSGNASESRGGRR